MGKLLADSFQSVNSAETKGKAQLTGQVQGFWKMIPNLKWEPQEILQDGNRVIVRSIASGNPQGNFMGIECDGSKAFSIMTIDIHTVENGQITQVFHVEEWATGMKQLKS
jgi:predicted ester cyclase